MPHPIRRLAALPLLIVLLVASSLAPTHATAWGRDGYTRDLYFASGYERQIDSRICTAAGTAMMMNFIARRDLGLNQLSILRF